MPARWIHGFSTTYFFGAIFEADLRNFSYSYHSTWDKRGLAATGKQTGSVFTDAAGGQPVDNDVILLQCPSNLWGKLPLATNCTTIPYSS